MNITLRQLGKLESCAATLEAAFDAKNPCAMRCVALVREVLDEIVSAPENNLELDFDLDFALQNCEPAAPKTGTKLGEIIVYGKELLAQGCSARDLVNMTMEHFALRQVDFARLIGVSQGTLSTYLTTGGRRAAILAGLTEAFGDVPAEEVNNG